MYDICAFRANFSLLFHGIVLRIWHLTSLKVWYPMNCWNAPLLTDQKNFPHIDDNICCVSACWQRDLDLPFLRVRPSVCPSHCAIVSERIHGWKHHTVCLEWCWSGFGHTWLAGTSVSGSDLQHLPYRDPVVYYRPTSSSAAAVTIPSGHRRSRASFRRTWPRDIHRFWCLHEVTRREDVSACFAVLRQLRSVPRSVPRSVLQSLLKSLVLTRLDYVNATLVGIPQYQFNRFQSVMNAAARLVFSASRYDHITPLLRQLHWLNAPERVEFKLAVVVYKCRQRTASSYLFEELCQQADFEAWRRLRSASSSSLVVRRTRLSTIGDRAFPVAAARIWNCLPPHVTSAPSLPVFRSRLKTHLFRRCFLWLHLLFFCHACEVACHNRTR